MHKEKERFIQILRVELDDLHDDIDSLMSECSHMWKEHKITELGYCGNLGVLKHEMLGVGTFSEILDDIDPSKYASLQEMIDDLEERLLAEIKRYGMVPAIDVIIRRKIDKVSKYLQAG